MKTDDSAPQIQVECAVGRVKYFWILNLHSKQQVSNLRQTILCILYATQFLVSILCQVACVLTTFCIAFVEMAEQKEEVGIKELIESIVLKVMQELKIEDAAEVSRVQYGSNATKHSLTRELAITRES